MFNWLKKRSFLFIVLSGYVFSLLFLLILTHIPRNYALAPLFLIPIIYVTWFSKTKGGIILASLFILTAAAYEIISKYPNVNYFALLWNNFMRFTYELALVYIISNLQQERHAARKDYLTGIANRQYFVELAEMEIKRSSRYKRIFSAAFIDIDSFKRINDNFGHKAGDHLLILMTNLIKSNIRNTDVFARLAGDEFVLIFPETDQEQSKVIINRIAKTFIETANKHKWPTTLSIGLATYLKAPKSVDDLLKKIDDLMYTAKKNGRNRTQSEVVDEYK